MSPPVFISTPVQLAESGWAARPTVVDAATRTQALWAARTPTGGGWRCQIAPAPVVQVDIRLRLRASEIDDREVVPSFSGATSRAFSEALGQLLPPLDRVLAVSIAVAPASATSLPRSELRDRLRRGRLGLICHRPDSFVFHAHRECKQAGDKNQQPHRRLQPNRVPLRQTLQAATL